VAIHRRAQLRRAFVAVAFLCSLSALVCLSAISADAAGGPEFLVQFGPTGSKAGQLTNPRGVATDPTTGHLYVGDLSNQRIDEFTAWGGFVKAWGFGVADGTTAAPQTCGPEATPPTAACFKGVQGVGGGGFKNPLGVAVDSSGGIYVVDFTNRRVQKFDSAGHFLLMFGGDVNKTKVEEAGSTEAEQNLCTAASGDVCQAGTTGTGQGQFGAWKVGSFIAVGPGDIVYVGDNNRVQEFNPDGTFNSELVLPETGFVESLAVDPSGNLYVASDQKKAPGIRKLSSSGTVLDTISSAVNGKGEPITVLPTALATDASGNLYEVDDQPSGPLPEVLKFNPAGEQKASFGEGEFTASTGIGTNVIGDVYVTNFTPTNSYVRAYGPLPSKFEPPPTVPPDIVSEYAASVGTTSAVVKAEINPHFFTTTYYVEYGTDDCSKAACAQQPAAPGTELVTQRQRAVPTSGVPLGGLTPGSVYHYRFVAVSDAGTVFGPDRTFKTYLPGSFNLPDGRAFEMVSPPDKNSGEAGVPGNPGSLVDPFFSVTPLQASVTGDTITYPSFTAFGDAHSAPAASRYLSERGPAGWSTENITPENQEGFTRDPFRGFSSDLSLSAVIQREPRLDPAAVEGFENLYLRNNQSGEIRALTTVAPRGPDATTSSYCVGFAGASADSSHVIFVAKGALTPDAPEESGASLYEWSAGQLSLVSVLPGEIPAQPSESAGFGAGGTGCQMNQSIVHNAISADGSRIFWTTGGKLFARLNGTETIQLDAPQGGPGPAGGGKFRAASNDGSRVFFTSPNQLTADASPESLGDLYMYDVNAKTLTDLTVDPTPGTDPPDVQGVLGASEAGAYVYFVADGVLEGGAVAGRPNLYLWHAGDGVRFIATLSTTDSAIHNNTGVVRFSKLTGPFSSWNSAPSGQTARVTPDGRHLAFMSVASLTGYDNFDQLRSEPVSQVYLYDAEGDELTCASCNPSGARPIGFSELPVWITPYEQPRYLSDDGTRLFFQSFDALSVNDTNGTQDVYEFERAGSGSCSAENVAFSASSDGCLFPISTGTDGSESYFLDASPDGRDVFLSSRRRLFSADVDERYDVYDARIGGGFPPPPPPPPSCLGEACRPPEAAPAETSPSSSAFFGEGNVKAAQHPPSRRCSKGRSRVRRHGKTRCLKRSGGNRAGHDRGAAR
jgi:NHL repeat-containing protein